MNPDQVEKKVESPEGAMVTVEQDLNDPNIPNGAIVLSVHCLEEKCYVANAWIRKENSYTRLLKENPRWFRRGEKPDHKTALNLVQGELARLKRWSMTTPNNPALQAAIAALDIDIQARQAVTV